MTFGRNGPGNSITGGSRGTSARTDARPTPSTLHAQAGGLRILDAPGVSVPPAAAAAAIRGHLVSLADRLGLAPADLASLKSRSAITSAPPTASATSSFRNPWTKSPSLRASCLCTSTGGEAWFVSRRGRADRRALTRCRDPRRRAVTRAAANVRPGQQFAAERRSSGGGARRASRFAQGPFRREVTSELTWLPMDGGSGWPGVLT